MKKFRTSYGKIEELEVIKETAKQIVYQYPNTWNGEMIESREMKDSSHHAWFETWEDAQEYLVEGARKSVEWAKQSLARAEKEYGKLCAMKKP